MRDYSVINNFIKEYCEENKATREEIEVYVFPQTWGSTALGFGGIGGQAITSSNTTVLYSYYTGMAWVYFGSVLAYKIKDPTQQFFEDLYKHEMKPCGHTNIYERVG